MNRKIIIFGLKDIHNMDFTGDSVIAISVLNENHIKTKSINLNNQNVPIINVKKITDLNFDFVIISDSNNFNNIYITCAKARIPQFKIISYDTYIHHLRNKVEYNVDDEQSLLKFINEHNIHRILDMDLYFADGVSTTRNRKNYAEVNDYGLSIPKELDLVGITGREYWPLWDNIYNRTYHDVQDVMLQYFDLLLIMKVRLYDEYIQIINNTYGSWKYAIFQVERNSSVQEKLQSLDYKGLNLKATWFDAQNTSWLILEKIANNIELYVICHKPYKLPELPNIYHPIHAGKNGSAGFGLPGDDTGENISFLNPYINELTAIYWMWKNTNSDIIGTAHYHRFFVNEPADNYIADSTNYLDEASTEKLLQSCDIILRRSIPYGNTEDCFRKFLGYDFYETAKAIFLEVIKNIAPDYEDAFLFALSRHNSGHAFNMFITRRHVFDAYCSWLFPIILEAANRIDFTQLPKPPHSRIIGFMGEALLMPWLMKQRLRIKELPVAELSHDSNCILK
ncbi:MAG: DUF4422 domain-containing protein [Anaerovibrio sp.]|uniref:DUF4422 domain-containing protein n=1 Tax=Anaerovibrio sp. TaxID=1872532 RepID=UPI0025F3D702|nr:DUF4422 domain-containing protein [Anaerovibrio sp.]MCR5175308.1 DUF4422 domain-containing protein [Anaerovibrio sp.]